MQDVAGAFCRPGQNNTGAGDCLLRRVPRAAPCPCQNSPFNTRPELADWALVCHASRARPHAQSAGAKGSAGPRTYSPRRQELSGCTFAAPGHTRVYGSDGGAGGGSLSKDCARLAPSRTHSMQACTQCKRFTHFTQRVLARPREETPGCYLAQPGAGPRAASPAAVQAPACQCPPCSAAHRFRVSAAEWPHGLRLELHHARP